MRKKRWGVIGQLFGKGERSLSTTATNQQPLDLSLLTNKPDRNWLACVDFGTALSKICIVRRHKPGTPAAPHFRPLEIGLQVQDESSELLAPSTLYIVQGRIYFGDQALEKHAQHNDPSRQCFQSPKQVLSEMAAGALDTPPPTSEDPEQSFRRSELMALLLAQLVWRADSAAQKAGVGTLPKLRFARPAWESDHAKRGEEQLLKLFAMAFAIASTLRERLVDAEGLDSAHARRVLDQVNDNTNLLPLLMRRVEVKEARAPNVQDCIDRGFVPEATAVAVAAIRPKEGLRRLFVVVDVGAGTSDFGAFITVPGDGSGRISELQRARRVVLRGGNFLDEQVVALLRDKAGLVQGMPSANGPLARLRRDATRIKEELFMLEEVTEELGNGQFVSAQLSELCEREPLKSFGNELWEKFAQALLVATEFTSGLTIRPRTIEVILTGGGSRLPMVQELINRARREWNYPVTLTDTTPVWIADTNWSRLFPQLAVAIGGAMPNMPEQRLG
jgi:molecular chaperone DnaK (HSP70)